MKKEEEVYELTLMDYKGIEREAKDQLVAGKKICMVSELMLDNAKKIIHQLGGKTMEEEDAIEQERRKEAAKSTTNDTNLS